jgi:hypothetical protein
MRPSAHEMKDLTKGSVGGHILQMGNTLPPLLSSLTRLVLFAVPAYALAAHPGFQMRGFPGVLAGAPLAASS